MTALERAIMGTLAYHGLFGFPMTAHEVRLSLPASAAAPHAGILDALDRLREAGEVGVRGGFWYVAGREDDVDRRRRCYDLAERKYRIARRFFRFARHAPFLRSVHVCNTLARSNAKEGSDIDLFIVTAPRRIWLTRLCVTGLAKLLGIRPDRRTSKDRLCLSFFITEDALDLRSHAIEGDVYLPRWLHDLYPLYDESGVSGKIFARNAWAREAVGGFRRQIPSERRRVRGGKGLLKSLLERLLGRDALESHARAFQLRVMPEKLKGSARDGRGVVISDTTLKLHGLDRREEIRDRYREAVAPLARTEEAYVRTA